MGNATSYDDLDPNTKLRLKDISEQYKTKDVEIVMQAINDMMDLGQCKSTKYEDCVLEMWKEVVHKGVWPKRISPDKEYVKHSSFPSKRKIERQYGVCTFHPSIDRGVVEYRDGVEWSKTMNFTIDRSMFLGSGSYGDVYIGKDSKGNQVAVKIINKSKLRHKGLDLSSVYGEIRIQSLLYHPHVLQILDVFEYASSIYIVTDVMQSDLLRFVNSNENQKISNTDIKCLLRQMFEALAYCHRQDVVHRDIKLDNILIEIPNVMNKSVCRAMCVKLADFGFATDCKTNEYLNTYPGTMMYASPEILRGKPYLGKNSDVWSMGVVTYIVATSGMTPFGAPKDYAQYVEAQKSMAYHFQKCFTTLDHKLQRLIVSMLSYDPLTRTTMDLALDDYYFKS